MKGSLSEQLMENRGRRDLLHIYELYILFFLDLKHISVWYINIIGSEFMFSNLFLKYFETYYYIFLLVYFLLNVSRVFLNFQN